MLRHISLAALLALPLLLAGCFGEAKVTGGKEEAKDANEEHDQIRASLKEVEEHEAGTELFALAVTQLVATTKHHVGVEETELLPDFAKASDDAERKELGRRFEEAKAKAPLS